MDFFFLWLHWTSCLLRFCKDKYLRIFPVIFIELGRQEAGNESWHKLLYVNRSSLFCGVMSCMQDECLLQQELHERAVTLFRSLLQYVTDFLVWEENSELSAELQPRYGLSGSTHTLMENIEKHVAPRWSGLCLCTVQPKGQRILLCFVQRRAPLLRPCHPNLAALGELQWSRSTDAHGAYRQRGTLCRACAALSFCFVLTTVSSSFVNTSILS